MHLQATSAPNSEAIRHPLKLTCAIWGLAGQSKPVAEFSGKLQFSGTQADSCFSGSPRTSLRFASALFLKVAAHGLHPDLVADGPFKGFAAGVVEGGETSRNPPGP